MRVGPVPDRALVRIEAGDPRDPGFLRLAAALDRELAGYYPPESIYAVEPSELGAPGACLLLARVGGEAVGCGALRRLEAGVGEVKRMYVAPEHRRRAIGRRLLAALEERAPGLGYRALRLETGSRQPEPAGLYRSAGWRPIPCFGEYANDPNSLCFEKRLDLPPAGD